MLFNSSWEHYIGTSMATMKRFRLNFDGSQELCKNLKKDNLAEIEHLKRYYNTITFDEMKISRNLYRSLANQLTHVRVLEIIKTEVTETMFKNLISGFSALEKLVLIDSNVTAVKKKANTLDKVHSVIPIPSLKSLVIVNSSWNIFKYIGECAVLKELKIHHETAFDLNHFSSFLNNQKALENLAIRVYDKAFYHVLVDEKGKKNSFKLKKLSVIYKNWGENEPTDQALIDFLEMHADTLEHLETNKKLCETQYEYIFSRLQLKTMIINVSQLPTRPLNYSIIKNNPHLKKLVLLDVVADLTAAQGILNIYRNLEHLEIVLWSDETANDILVFIANNMPKLKTLSIPELVANPPELSISSLKSLCIGMVDNAANFQAFTENQLSLEDLNIKWVKANISEELGMLTARLRNLKRLTFGPDFKATNRILETIKSNCPELHTLELFRDYNNPITPEVLDGINGNGLRVYEYSEESAIEKFKSTPTMWDKEDNEYGIDQDDDSDQGERLIF